MIDNFAIKTFFFQNSRLNSESMRGKKTSINTKQNKNKTKNKKTKNKKTKKQHKEHKLYIHKNTLQKIGNY